MTWEPTELTERLAAYVEDGFFCKGVQTSVWHDGQVYDFAMGSAGPGLTASTSSIWRIYCTGKPVLAVATALLVQRGLLELDRAIGVYLGDDAVKSADVTCRQLLTHTAGLHSLFGPGIGALSFSTRDRKVRGLTPPAGWNVQNRAAYSEYAAWHLLGLVIEAVAGVPATTFIRKEVLDPIDVRELWFQMSDPEYDALCARIAVGYDLRGHEPVPMLAHRSRQSCTNLNLAYGGYGTARALRSFYESILRALEGDPQSCLEVETAKMLVSSQRGRRHDETFQRTCDFGLGFMTDLEGHGFEPCMSRQAFGHSGYLGSSVAFADPAAGLVMALVWNGIVDGEVGLRVRRNAAIRALYRDIGARMSPA